MNRRYKELLQPFGQKLAQMDQMLIEMSDEEIEVLLEAAAACNATNCWCYSYDAAQWLKIGANTELSRRGLARRQADQTSHYVTHE